MIRDWEVGADDKSSVVQENQLAGKLAFSESKNPAKADQTYQPKLC